MIPEDKEKDQRRKPKQLKLVYKRELNPVDWDRCMDRDIPELFHLVAPRNETLPYDERSALFLPQWPLQTNYKVNNMITFNIKTKTI